VTPNPPHTRRLASAFAGVFVLLLAALAALSFTGTAAAATPCGKKILGDWFDNGRIDRLYPLHCYEEAIDAIPPDIKDYADAEEVIDRALQAALRGKLDKKGGPDPTPGNDNRNPGAPAGGSGPGSGGSGGTEATGIDTSGPSSVPIPLLVLGGIALALLGAGGLGYVSRRRAAHADDVDDDTVG
jgi:hypothetical protein